MSNAKAARVTDALQGQTKLQTLRRQRSHLARSSYHLVRGRMRSRTAPIPVTLPIQRMPKRGGETDDWVDQQFYMLRAVEEPLNGEKNLSIGRKDGHHQSGQPLRRGCPPQTQAYARSLLTLHHFFHHGRHVLKYLVACDRTPLRNGFRL